MKFVHNKLTLSLISLLSLSPAICSCVGEDDAPAMLSDEVAFTTGAPGVDSRANYDLPQRFLADGFAVTAYCPEDAPGAGDILGYHCLDATVRRQPDGLFRGDGCRWASNEKDKIGSLKFFAFHPTRAVMRDSVGVGDECFVYTNATVKDASGIRYDLRLSRFRVAPDISKQVDFVSAIGQGNKTAHLYSGIKINFEHQLSGVELSAWGASALYDIEVAGWRVGGIVVEADFSLSAEVANRPSDQNSIGEWYIDNNSPRGYVDYVFAPNDKVVRINASEHNTKETAVSLLGGGGRAMLIPQKQALWDYKNDRTDSPKGMYFSALVRITEHDGDQHCIFPSKDPQSQDYIVYLSVLKSDGTVMERLDKHGNVYGTSTPYHIPPTEELRYYGWAAAPAQVDWKPGYTYHYVLDYTKGVGVHDPYDHNPAATVVNWGGVEVTTTTGNWSSGGVVSEGGWGSNTNATAPDGTVWWK